ncbi:autotransporter outer membrane beta-barrel domain-containing protein [Dyella sp. EPa41]|uniref:autotransporter outer membrane beta-barrel domain-containing protein n=1 Tax=Dyella sp. EPa41 TaxID=1561194 RepID=UPI0019164E9E|nr:autotransporter outer membrane beta-barrel domain-containing protein [Dyella sp. EPa41]
MRLNPLAVAIDILFPVGTVLCGLLPSMASAQTLGPGVITTTQDVSSGSQTVVGGTTIQPASGNALDVSGTGSVLLDSSVGGPIILTGATGSGLHVSGMGAVISKGSSLSISSGGTSQSALDVNGSGNVALSNAAIHSTGLFSGIAGAYGVIAQPGASITLTNGSVTTEEAGNIGVYAHGGQVSLANVAVVTRALTAYGSGSSSYGAYGVSVFSGGFARIAGGSVNTYGDYGIGVRSSGPGASVDASGTAIKTQGGNGYGAMATGGAVMDLANLGITTGGVYGIGLYSRGSTLTSVDTTVVTSGENGWAAYATQAGTLNLTGGTVATSGAQAHGLSAGGAGSLLTASQVLVSTSAILAIGAYASDGGNISVNGGSLTTRGAYAFGAAAEGDQSKVMLSGVSVRASGQTAHGLAALEGGTIEANGVVVDIKGPGAAALYVAGQAGTVDTARISNSALRAVGQAGIWVAGGTANVTLANTSVSGNAQWLAVSTSLAPSPYDPHLLPASQPSISADGVSEITQSPPAPGYLVSGIPATLNLVASGSTLDGSASKDPWSTSNVTLKDGTLWKLTENSTVTNLVNDSSSVVFSLPADPRLAPNFKTLTVVNYTGAPGGSIKLNAYLGDDNSASDRLVINGGTATGSTQLLIHATGSGDQRTRANGILVVDAINQATTAPGAFYLGNTLRVGAYNYDLLRGAVDGSSTENWYLRSAMVVSPASPVSTGQPASLPAEPPLAPLPPGIYPIIGPEIATYGAVQPSARRMGLTTLGTMHERIGDTLTPASAQEGPDGWARSAWARVLGQEVDDHYRAFADPRTSGRILGAQAGFDVWQGSMEQGHRDAMGVYLAYANTHADVDGLVANQQATGYALAQTGRINMDAVSGGGYWTHYGPTGWYLDGVVQGTRYDGTARTENASLIARGNGIIASLEGGYPFALSWGPNFILEPQAQVVWQRIWFRQMSDDYGSVSLGASSGVTARLGVRGQWTIARGNGQVWQPYLRANLWRDMGGGSTVTYSGVDQAPLVSQATRADAAIGVTAKLLSSLSVYAQFGYQFGLESRQERRNGVAGDVGMRYRW